MEVRLMTNILQKNDQLAEELRSMHEVYGIFTVNLMGSPGSGKTTLLENTLAELKDVLRIAVIEGDLFTSKDADRIAKQGVKVLQINTAGGCHLDAGMVMNAVCSLDLGALDLIIIENVGNLVCPAEFDLGEDIKVTVLSVTEGEDKPLKYPLVFKQAEAVLINKTDLLPYTSFDMENACEDITNINPGVTVFQVSCRTGEGLSNWYSWLRQQVAHKKTRSQADD